jgi:thiamine pyrophosphate-dependent acetolactate synthase large subunit-like protein
VDPDTGDLSSQRTDADLIVRALTDEGVRTVFGIPGTHNLALYAALRRSTIRHVAPRHEQGGGYAADGYARAGGGPGVLITTSGPGATNAATAIGTAYADSIPMLVISAGMRTGSRGRGLGQLHEMRDQFATLSSIADRAVCAEDGAAAAAFVHDVFADWRVGRTRPAYLQLPYDMLGRPAYPGRVDPVVSSATTASPRGCDGPTIDAVVARIASAERTVLVLGGGAQNAADLATRFAEMAEAVVITTAAGKGVVPERHPQSLGAVIDLPEAHRVIETADLVLVVGSELAESELGANTWQPLEYLVRVDIDDEALTGRWLADRAVRADAREFLGSCLLALERLGPSRRRTGTAKLRAAMLRAELDRAVEAHSGHWAEINRLLSDALPRETIVAGDSSQVSYRGTMYCWPMDRPRQFLYPAGFATLGYGLPAAIGARLAQPARPVLALQGDGALMFSVQELMTATALRLPIPIVVMNNGGYAEIRDQMREQGIEPLGTDLAMPDFAALSTAFGAHGVRAATAAEVPTLVLQAWKRDRPTVIEVQAES